MVVKWSDQFIREFPSFQLLRFCEPLRHFETVENASFHPSARKSQRNSFPRPIFVFKLNPAFVSLSTFASVVNW